MLICALFFAVPFLLSTNLFIVVGTTVAERVLYLPSLGAAMLYGLVFSGTMEEEEDVLHPRQSSAAADSSDRPSTLVDRFGNRNCNGAVLEVTPERNKGDEPLATAPPVRRDSSWWKRGLALVAYAGVLGLMAQKCSERNDAWSNQVYLWESAYAVNPNR